MDRAHVAVSQKTLSKYCAGASLIWFLVVLVFVAGLALVGFAAQDVNLSRLKSDEEIANNLSAIKPALSAEQAADTRQVIKVAETKDVKESTIDILMRDIGISLLSSAILVLVIEWYARSNMDREIRLGVIEATFKRLIPMRRRI
jgi:hypothetical protein